MYLQQLYILYDYMYLQQLYILYNYMYLQQFIIIYKNDQLRVTSTEDKLSQLFV
jgi:hypothetical protein